MQHNLDSLALRAKFVRALLLAYAAVNLLIAPLPFIRTTQVVNLDGGFPITVIATATLVLVDLAIQLGLVVMFPLWVYRARANLSAMGLAGLRYSPIWSALSFFVPLVGLFVPFLAVRQLYNRSIGEGEYQADTVAPDVTSWWACYVSGTLVAAYLAAVEVFNLNGMVFIVTPAIVTNIITVFDSLLLLGAALFLWRIVGTVTRAQQGYTGIAEAFA